MIETADSCAKFTRPSKRDGVIASIQPITQQLTDYRSLSHAVSPKPPTIPRSPSFTHRRTMKLPSIQKQITAPIPPTAQMTHIPSRNIRNRHVSLTSSKVNVNPESICVALTSSHSLTNSSHLQETKIS